MSLWPLKNLGDPEICSLNPKKGEISSIPDDTPVSFVPMAQVDGETGVMDASGERLLGEVRKGYTYFSDGDVVFAKITPCMENGKSAIARNLKNGIGFGTTEFHVLRSGPLTIPEWLHLFVRNAAFREEAKKNMHGAAGQQRVPVNFLRDAKMPVPPLDEQTRIVTWVEELTRHIEEMLKMRKNAMESTSKQFFHVRRRLFEELSSKWPKRSLGKCGKVLGGGTPSKKRGDYWAGDIPWIAPKEVKTFKISTSSQKITETAIAESSAKLIPAGSVLFVVRGMILSRYVPVAVSEMPCAINQDMKAIVPARDILPDYLAHMLWGANDILQGMVETAGHGTKKLQTPSWSSLQVPIPDTMKQQALIDELTLFQNRLTEVEKLQDETEKEIGSFQSALLAKAFRGEL